MLASRAVASVRGGHRLAHPSSSSSTSWQVVRTTYDRQDRPRRSNAPTTSTQRRWASTKETGKGNDVAERSIAVLGGGLSGLCTALFLARSLLSGPKRMTKKPYRIVLYEASDRLGGWVHSERLTLPPPGEEFAANAKSTAEDDGADNTALFERGPRSVRVTLGVGPMAMMHLIATLNLGDKVISVPKSAPSAQNRLLYHGGRFHNMPRTFGGLAVAMLDSSHPLRKAKAYRIWPYLKNLDRFIKSRKAEVAERGSRLCPDESVETVGKEIFGVEAKSPYPDGTPCVGGLDYLVSAVLHGIYAADVSQLSFRSVFPGLYKRLQITLAAKSRGEMQEFWNDIDVMYDRLARDGHKWAKLAKRANHFRLETEEELLHQLGDRVLLNMADTSVLSFDDGIQTLTDAVADECRKLGVEVHVKTPVDELTLASGEKAKVTAGGKKEQFDRVVSTLPSTTLRDLLKEDSALSGLAAFNHNASANVCVINVAVPKWAKYQIPAAFGFLLPRACALEGDNPLGLLGVVFDSEAVPGQDECTKLTMMIGGPYWKPGFEMYDIMEGDGAGKHLTKAERQAAAMDRALEVLAKHMGTPDKDTFKAPFVLKRLSMQSQCIPTFAPGHISRMHELREFLNDDEKYAALTVSGASFTGLAMNDIVLNARLTSANLAAIDLGKPSPSDTVTGLEFLQ